MGLRQGCAALALGGATLQGSLVAHTFAPPSGVAQVLPLARQPFRIARPLASAWNLGF
jgi:hypothetical protein